jgi:hypothetical protein
MLKLGTIGRGNNEKSTPNLLLQFVPTQTPKAALKVSPAALLMPPVRVISN